MREESENILVSLLFTVALVVLLVLAVLTFAYGGGA